MLTEEELKRINDEYHETCKKHSETFCSGCPYNHFFCKMQFAYEKGFEAGLKAKEEGLA